MYTWPRSRANARARRHRSCLRRDAAAASRSARAGALPSRETILRATSRPELSSRASQTDPDPPEPSGRIGRYRPSTRDPGATASAVCAINTVRLAARKGTPPRLCRCGEREDPAGKWATVSAFRSPGHYERAVPRRRHRVRLLRRGRHSRADASATPPAGAGGRRPAAASAAPVAGWHVAARAADRPDRRCRAPRDRPRLPDRQLHRRLEEVDVRGLHEGHVRRRRRVREDRPQARRSADDDRHQPERAGDQARRPRRPAAAEDQRRRVRPRAGRAP